MGSCQSSLSRIERDAYEDIINSISIHCQQEIIKLPKKKFFNIYKFHLIAKYYLQQKEYQMALLNECLAIQNLELLLSDHKDHVIFAPMHNLLSLCFWETMNMQLAILEGLITLKIILKHMATDYIEIGLQYFRVAVFCLLGRQFKSAERYFIKSIEIAQLGDGLQLDFIQKVEVLLQTARAQISGSPLRIIPINYESGLDENREDLIRRATNEMSVIANQFGTFQINETELKRLPDKQTELIINKNILNDILNSLITFLKENDPLNKLGIKGSGICFVAAYFKSIQMETSSLSIPIIEAGLTIIINQINDDDRFTPLKQLPFTISYTDDDQSNIAGVRVFQIKGITKSNKQ
ncbi:unnamed protein product [Adineta steineri]|uniref:Uncharacterized protein n=2 Tax=Adineta steineri TaxID=433720 RepID=A0A818XEG0_9BILA|nr:unnamed protein product [Adineta steineri]CAF3737656.1 unnamed protein product [Adineta steineri]